MADVIPGAERFESFVQSIGLIQQSPRIALALIDIEQRIPGWYTLEDALDLIDEYTSANPSDNYHYILQTSRHAMLISYLIDEHAEKEYYTFFDANFGLAAFEDYQDFEVALHHFLVQQGYAEHAYSALLDSDAAPLFQIRRVNAGGMAELTLSTADDLPLSSLYEDNVAFKGGLISRTDTVVNALDVSAFEGTDSLTGVERQHFLNDLFLKTKLVADGTTAQDFRDQAKLDKFYQDYLTFLEQVEREYIGADLDPGGFNLQQLVSRLYYYPDSAVTQALTESEKIANAEWLALLAKSPDIIEGRPVLSDFIIHAPDGMDKEVAFQLRRGFERVNNTQYGVRFDDFESFTINADNAAEASSSSIVNKIAKAGRIEFVTADFHQRLHDVTHISKLVINLKKERMQDLMLFLRHIHKDPVIGHRVLTASMAGFNYYDRSSEKATIYFSGRGEAFTRELHDRVLSLIESKGWQTDLLDITPVGMYPLEKGISYQLEAGDRKLTYGAHYQWGTLDSPIKPLSPRLLSMSTPKVLDELLSLDRLNQTEVLAQLLGGGGNYFNNPALAHYPTLGAEHAFSEADFREELSIIAARMRTLKYHDIANYQQYRQGLADYKNEPFEPTNQLIVERYLRHSKQQDESLFSLSKVALMDRLKRSETEPHLVGRLLGYALEGVANQAQLSITQSNALENNEFGGVVVSSGDQTRILGVSGDACCYNLSLMVTGLLKTYGEYGAKIFLEQVAANNETLLHFLYATSNAVNRPPYEPHVQRLTLSEVFEKLSQSPARAGVVFLNGHSLSVVHQGNRYYVYDPKTALRRYDNRAQAIANTEKLIEKSYAYRFDDLGEKQVGFDASGGYFSLKSKADFLHSRLALLDYSMSDMIHAFAGHYITPSFNQNSAGRIAWNDSQTHRQTLLANHNIIATDKDYIASVNRPIIELSNIVKRALIALGQTEVGSQSMTQKTRGEFIEAFKEAYADYVEGHDAEGHVVEANGRDPAAISSRVLGVSRNVARAFLIWSKEWAKEGKEYLVGYDPILEDDSAEVKFREGQT